MSTAATTKTKSGLERAMATFVSKMCKAEKCGECDPDHGRWPCTHDCHQTGEGADGATDEAKPETAAADMSGDLQQGNDAADAAPEPTPTVQGPGDEEVAAAAVSDGPGPTFAMLPLDRVVPSADNPRRHLDVTDEMVDSVKAVGILEPLVVERCADPDELEFHGYHVIAGHRRLEAAERAGLTYLPCVVREPMDAEERLELMLIENLQRADLVPLDEARGYERLVELGLTQRTIAEKVGCNQSHVSRRLGLLLLPNKAQDELDAGGITLEEATALARMHKDPKRIEVVLKEKGNRQYALERQLREFDQAEKEAKTRAQLKKAGVPIVEIRSRHDDGVRDLGDDSWDLMTVEAHGTGECFAAYIDHYGEAAYVCLNEGNHPDVLAAEEDEEADEQRPDDVDREAWKAEQERRRKQREDEQREHAEATAARRAVAKSIVESKVGSEERDFIAFMLVTLASEEDTWPDVEATVELLGIEFEPGDDEYGVDAVRRALREWAAQGPTNRARSALAAALSIVEGSDTYAPSASLLERHLGFLCDHGYVMHRLDEERLANARREEPEAE